MRSPQGIALVGLRLGSIYECRIRKYIQRHLGRDACRADQSLAHLIQEGVPPPLLYATAPLVYQAEAYAVAPTTHLYIEIDLRNWYRMHLPQHIALYKTFQKAIRLYSCDLSQHTS